MFRKMSSLYANLDFFIKNIFFINYLSLNISIQIEVSMDVVDGCNKTSNLVITNIQLPLEYDYVSIVMQTFEIQEL